MWAGGSLEFVERMKPNVKISKISELHEVVSREKDRPESIHFEKGFLKSFYILRIEI